MSPLCGNCGIMYEEESISCPLCAKTPSETSSSRADRGREDKHFRDVITFAGFSTGLIVFITDFAYGGPLDWAGIPLFCLGYLWLTFFILSFLQRRRYLRVPAISITTGVFLYFLSGFTSESGWFLGVVVPILLCFTFISLLVMAVIRIFRLSFIGRVSSCLAGAGFLTICIDFTVNPGVSWSLVAASGAVPLMVFLSGFESRLRRNGSSLEKYFHV